MSITRLSPDEFIEKMRSCKKWMVKFDSSIHEMRLTVCTPANNFETWLGPDPRDVGNEGYQDFIAQLNRAMRIYEGRQLSEIVPDGGYPVNRGKPSQVIHRTRHQLGKD